MFGNGHFVGSDVSEGDGKTTTVHGTTEVWDEKWVRMKSE